MTADTTEWRCPDTGRLCTPEDCDRVCFQAPAEGDVAELARWLHAAYDRPPQTPEVRAMLAKADALATQPQPKGMPGVLRQRCTVYVLNERGENRWSALVQPGRDDDDRRVSDDECEAVAEAIRAALTAQAPAPAHQSKPMSEVEINKLISQHEVFEYHPGALLEYTRAVEQALGGRP